MYCNFTAVGQFDSTMDKTSGDRHVWTFNHTYVVGDTYNVIINMSNLVSNATAEFEFKVVEELHELG